MANDCIISLMEKMRPSNLADYFGQQHIIGGKTVLKQLLEKKRIVSTILWGPPGCGKTSLAHIIASLNENGIDKTNNFMKLSATTSGIKDIRDIVEMAVKDKINNQRKTIVYMSEIHRFNKLQQDIFLPHIETGTFILIGETRENPSFSLNSALLSRCRVYQLKKLTEIDIKNILLMAIASLNGKISEEVNSTADTPPKYSINSDCLDWLAIMCDGNAKIGLNTLELAVKSIKTNQLDNTIPQLTVNDIKINLEKAYHMISDKTTDENHELVSAMHKSIRANHANGALYWLARLMATGEDPVYIGKRLIRITSEDVGILDSNALDTAVHAMHACQMIGMPECDVLLAQCVIYLCRARKLIVNTRN